MTVVLPMAACFGLAVAAALRLTVLRSGAAGCDDMRCEFDDRINEAAIDTPRFPYFG